MVGDGIRRRWMRCCRAGFEIWMNRGNLSLSSLQHRNVPSPGNGCGNTGNGGNSCVGSRKVASRHGDGALTPPLTPATSIDH
ncbi:hypothetical protein QVD17_17224 [Tagetes erecta]|uniref:Uncharacterized protein n=1 Tax=Tagetes erecta TaxID=13708 RepID=A0AAD8KWE8_TARER|nr:hypothetical protein QVD17_17224 [Tagetes erecta]